MELISITDSLDKIANKFECTSFVMSNENKQLRLKNQQHHKDIYHLKEQMAQLDAKIKKLEQEKKKNWSKG